MPTQAEVDDQARAKNPDATIIRVRNGETIVERPVLGVNEQRTPEQDAALQELVDQAQELDFGYGQSTKEPE
jgi:hypothetical protein